MAIAGTKEMAGSEHIYLKDLVTLKSQGKLPGAIKMLKSGESIQGLLCAAALDITKEGVADNIIRKAVASQFTDKWAALRELAQNAMDSYAQGERRVVDINFDSGKELLTVTDRGCGMANGKVVNDLLIPFETSKPEGSGKSGEHGIGWFSCLDLADRVDVITKASDTDMTVAHVRKDEKGEWTLFFDLVEPERARQHQRGTQVVIHLAERGNVREKTHQYLGYVAKDRAEIYYCSASETFRVNTLEEGFTLVGSSTTSNSRGTGDLCMCMKETDSGRMNWLLTHNGLYMDERGDPPFGWRTPHRTLWEAMREAGVQLWVDIPVNLGSTKGRRDVVPKDKGHYLKALYDTFEEAVITTVLDNEALVQKLDLKLADFVKAAVTGESQDRVKQDIEVAVQLHIYGEDAFARERARRSDTLTPEERMRAAESDVDTAHMGEFARRLRGKVFIPVTFVENGVERKAKVSITQMEEAAKAKTLFSDEFYKIGSRGDGMYVEGKHKIGNEMYYALTKTEKPEEAKERTTREQKEREEVNLHLMQHVPLDVVRRISRETGTGLEFRALLAISRRIDDLMVKASGINPSEVMLHLYPKELRMGQHVAHTDSVSISLNLSDRNIVEIVDAVRTGHFDELTLRKLAELLIHEKAHALVNPGRQDHGREFDRQKVKLHGEFSRHCLDNGVDVLAEANKFLLACGKMEQTSYETFMQLAETDASYEKAKKKVPELEKKAVAKEREVATLINAIFEKARHEASLGTRTAEMRHHGALDEVAAIWKIGKSKDDGFDNAKHIQQILGFGKPVFLGKLENARKPDAPEGLYIDMDKLPEPYQKAVEESLEILAKSRLGSAAELAVRELDAGPGTAKYFLERLGMDAGLLKMAREREPHITLMRESVKLARSDHRAEALVGLMLGMEELRFSEDSSHKEEKARQLRALLEEYEKRFNYGTWDQLQVAKVLREMVEIAAKPNLYEHVGE